MAVVHMLPNVFLESVWGTRLVNLAKHLTNALLELTALLLPLPAKPLVPKDLLALLTVSATPDTLASTPSALLATLNLQVRAALPLTTVNPACIANQVSALRSPLLLLAVPPATSHPTIAEPTSIFFILYLLLFYIYFLY
jgi:hypothetical protein